MRVDAFSSGYRIYYKEGDESLQRSMIIHKEDLNDTIYTIKEGDTITSISYRFYNEPLYWFIIADVNNIENPLELTIGNNIIIPNINKYQLNL